MVVDVFIRSYFRDVAWLRLCLAAIDHFVHGYRRIVLVIPRSSVDRMPESVAPARLPLQMVVCDDYGDDYVGQQVTKFEADLHTDADFIAHLDSDCVFLRKVDIASLFVGGRPIHVFRARSTRPIFDGWRQSIEQCLGRRTAMEFMVAVPAIYPRWIYADLREACRTRLGTTLVSHVLSRRGDRISEFNLLGTHAWYCHRDSFHWLEAGAIADDWPCRQFWSRRGMTVDVKSALPAQLQSYVR